MVVRSLGTADDYKSRRGRITLYHSATDGRELTTWQRSDVVANVRPGVLFVAQKVLLLLLLMMMLQMLLQRGICMIESAVESVVAPERNSGF